MSHSSRFSFQAWCKIVEKQIFDLTRQERRGEEIQFVEAAFEGTVFLACVVIDAVAQCNREGFLRAGGGSADSASFGKMIALARGNH